MLTSEFLPLPLLLLIIALWILPIVRWFEAKFKIWQVKSYLSFIWSLLVSGSLVYEIMSIGPNEVKSYYPIENPSYRTVELILTRTNLTLLLFVSVIFSAVMLYSIRYLKWESLVTDEGDYKLYYYILMFLSFTGLMIVIIANDAFSMFIGWELMVVPGYALIALRPRKASSEAGLKYALQSTLGSIFLMYGIVLLYELTGSFNLTVIIETIANDATAMNNVVAWQAITFLLIGFGVTAGFAGMQTWIPDAYGEVPSNVGAFISGGFALAAIVGIFKLVIQVFDPQVFGYGKILLWGGIITMTLGNLGAIQQTDIRRFLGYSSIAQRGYLLFGLGIVSMANLPITDTITAVYAQAIAYLILEGVLFITVGNLLYLYFQKMRTRDIRILEGGAKHLRITGFAIVLAGLGLSGIPPTFGFTTKLSLVIIAGIGEISAFAFGLFVVNSLTSIYYYVTFVQRLVMKKPNDELKQYTQKESLPKTMNATTFLLILLCILLSLKPDLWISLI